MANAMVSLATTTLGSAASTVTFGSIPGTYRDLRLVIQGSASTSTSTRLRLNGDTGSNYSKVRMYGAGGSAGSDSNTDAFLDISNMTTGSGYMATIDFMDYSATDKHKTLLARTQESDISAVLATAARWASTSAVTTILVYPGTGNYAAGSTFSLYGVIS